MSTGAIFTRGSRRALTWVVMLSALLVLPAGEAAAQQAITVSKTNVSATEGVAAASAPASQKFTVQLAAAVTSDTTVTLATSAVTNATFVTDPATLTFTAAGGTSPWNTAQTVTVTADEETATTDNNVAGTGTLTLSIAGGAIPDKEVSLAEVDNDPTMMRATPDTVTVTEGAAGTSFSLSVDKIGEGGTLDAAVAVTVSVLTPATNASFEYSADGGLSWALTLPHTLPSGAATDSFGAGGDGDQTIYVRAAEDNSNTTNGSVTLLIQGTSTVGTIAAETVTITETDNDRVVVPVGKATGITVSPGSLQVNEGGAGTFMVSLNGTPEVDVTVAANAGVPGMAADNADFRYTFGNTNAAADPTTMMFTFPKGVAPTPQPVTVTALDDPNPVNGRTVITFSTTAAGITPRNLTLTEADNDGAGVVLSTTALQVQEGGAAQSYTIRLGSAPANAPVTITPSVANVNANVAVWADSAGTTARGSLTFTSANWDTPQMVYVRAARDTNTTNGSAKISHRITTIDGEYAAVRAGTVSVTEIDSVRTVELTLSTDTVKEGQTVSITAALGNPGGFTGAPTLDSDLVVSLSKKAGTTEAGDYSIPGNKVTILAGTRSAAVTLTANHDHDADDESLTLTASISGGGGALQIEGSAQELALDIEDDDTYTLTSDRTELPEGEKATLTVKVDPPAALRTKVAIDLYRASGATVTPGPGDTPDHKIIAIGQTTATFELETAKDRDKDHETIEVLATAGSESTATGRLTVVGDELTIMVRDAQADAVYTLTADPTFVTEAGGEQSVMVTVMADKAAAADTMLTLAVDDASTAMSDDYSIMPAEMMVTIAKGEKSGMAELMVTPVADSMDEEDETIVLTAWMEDAMVGNAVTVTLIDSDSVSSGITAKSNAEALKVFEDAIMMAGGLQAGGESAYVDMSMLFNVADPGMAVAYSVSSSDTDVLGLYTSATDSTLSDVTLRLDPMMEGMSTVTVMAEAGNGAMAVSTLTAFTCSGACVSVNIDVGAAGTPVPALPLVGQGLLALFLFGAGVYRRYRSR